MIATTRPETIMGDTAVAVNPEDDRMKKYIGKKVIVPLVNREVEVIADDYVDIGFGTGAVKITPAHDPNDFAMGERHHLESIMIMNLDGTMNDKAGAKYDGMTREECRKAVVADLQELSLLDHIEPLTHSVGHCSRCKTIVEPFSTKQWFVKMGPLTKAAIDAVDEGKTRFIPERFSKTYNHWMENVHDWCISRQLWWGHRIPAYYCDDCGEMVVQKGGAPKVCPKCGGKHFTQDPDTLDTWFSSALWPFSTLGWPEKTEDYEYFYPTDVLVTGYDIIFFWVIRMVFSAIEQTGKVPFHHVLIHGLVRDDKGRKMSKSLGNGIDPLEVIDKYGADALRLTLMTGNAPGNDMRFYWERVENSRNFANKVWNASRFIQMNLDGFDLHDPKDSDFHTEDRAIISLVNTLVKDVTENMEKYELGVAVGKVYDFIWDEFCDWYIEMVKPRMYAKDTDPESANAALFTLKNVLSIALKLLHPYMPFITEEIYCSLNPEEETIMTSAWPEYEKKAYDEKAEEVYARAKEIVKGMRAVRKDMDVPNSKKATLYIVSTKAPVRILFEENTSLYQTLCNANAVKVQKDNKGIDEKSVSFVIADATCFVPLAELVDMDKERERLEKEHKRLEGELKRSKGMLSNEKFLAKAPKAKVDEEKAKLEKYEQMMTDVKKRLSDL